jgi:tetratricopeptide (TPR) repeat protein
MMATIADPATTQPLKMNDSTLPLDCIGIAEGTDKSSLVGDYLRHYEACFAALRDQELNLIEIGVLDGASLRMWTKFFDRAQIVGVDINPDCRAHAQGRVQIEIGSQEDPEFLHRLVTAYPPQIIIDDGSHRSDHIIFTFERLFPTLRRGGFYVVEDLHFHLMESQAELLRGSSKILANEYFLDLANEHIGGRHRLPHLGGLKKHLVASIESIEFVAQAVLIKKRSEPADRAVYLNGIRVHVEASGNWLNWLCFGTELRDSGRPAQEVIEAYQKSLALNPQAVVTYERLSEALDTAGKHDEAIAILKRATEIAKADPERVRDLKSRIESLSRRNQ